MRTGLFVGPSVCRYIGPLVCDDRVEKCENARLRQYSCVYVEGGVAWICMPLPTCLQRYCNSASLLLFLLPLSFFGQGPQRGRRPMLSHIWGIFSFSFSSSSSVPPPLKSQSRGPNSSLKAQIPVLRPKSQLQGQNPSLQAQILAWRPRFGP